MGSSPVISSQPGIVSTAAVGAMESADPGQAYALTAPCANTTAAKRRRATNCRYFRGIDQLVYFNVKATSMRLRKLTARASD